MYHVQALYKEPRGGHTPWHADQYYWPFATDRCVTVWIPLQDTPADLGPLAFAERSQSFEIGRDLAISDESERGLQAALTAARFPVDDPTVPAPTGLATTQGDDADLRRRRRDDHRAHQQQLAPRPERLDAGSAARRRRLVAPEPRPVRALTGSTSWAEWRSRVLL